MRCPYSPETLILASIDMALSKPHPINSSVRAVATSNIARVTTRRLASFALCASIISLLTLPAVSVAMDEQYTSTDKQVALLELFTSEGCSSCPPAEDWFNELTEADNLWDSFVPVVFHVDYWDYIGWPDRFARKQYGKRQRQYAQELSMRTVYTPGVFRDGQEWRRWRSASTRMKNKDSIGVLSATRDGDKLKVKWMTAQAPDYNYSVNVARLGFDLVTEVKKGENAGKTLTHEFVALGHDEKRLKSSGATEYSVTIAIPKIAIKNTTPQRHALAIWVTADGLQQPLQATGGWIKF